MTQGLDALLDALADHVAARVVEILDEREHVRRGPKDLPSSALRIDEAARRLGLSEREIYRQVASGALHSVKVGRVRLIPLSALDDFLNSAERTRAS